jgi:hypothetical protein
MEIQNHTAFGRVVRRAPLIAGLVLTAGAISLVATSLAGKAPKKAVSIVSKSIECQAGMPVQALKLRDVNDQRPKVVITVRLIRDGESIATVRRSGRITGRTKRFRLSLGGVAASAMPYCRLLSGSRLSGLVISGSGDNRKRVRFVTVGGPQRAVTTRFEILGSAPAPISEASGLVESRESPGTFWTHNDSGGAAALYALDESAALLATQPVSGVANNDWEDVAIGPASEPGRSALYVGEIGDNIGVRGQVRVYRIPEPDLAGTAHGSVLAAVVPETTALVYPDGARDAEALVVDPESGAIFVITKPEPVSRVYLVRNPVFGTGTETVLEFLGEMDVGGVVAADACPDGETVLVKTYFGISAYVDPDGVEEALTTQSGRSRLYSIDLSFPQDESVAADPYCTGYSTLPEGSGAPLRRFVP